MRLHLNKRLQRIAQLLLVIMLLNILQPMTAFALTSGPSQPEAMSFQPVGMTDMVDLSTGDFKYNIPLLDVDGYPINLNYQSGSGIDDEATWVGLGWNLNVGSINRQLRGIPDDFKGDEITTEHSVKNKITVGGRLTTKIEFGGALEGKEESKLKVNGSLSIGVFSDNYTGVGAEFGANVGMSYGLSNSSGLTGGMGLGVLSNTSSGVDVTPYVSLSLQTGQSDKTMTQSSLSTSLTYNSRSGIKSFSLSQSFNVSKTLKYYAKNSAGVFEASGVGAKLGTGHSMSLLSYNTDPIIPKIQVPFEASYESFSFDAGFAAWGGYAGAGATGYRNIRYVRTSPIVNPSYGFLYADLGKDQPTAMLDFIREKDNPVISELPNLALPVHTPDLFYYNSQKSSGQFRLYRAGTGIFNDNIVVEQSKANSTGIDLGFGKYVHAGITAYDQTSTTKTGKWTNGNDYLRFGDFQSFNNALPVDEPVYFKRTDERTIEDSETNQQFAHHNLVQVNLDGNKAKANLSGNSITENIEKHGRNLRKTNISYLTANEAAKGGLDKGIKFYPFLNDANNPANWQTNYTIDRVDPQDPGQPQIRKQHHISEITVTDTDNGRLVYGIPVYNLKQHDYSFAIGQKKFGNNNGYELLPGNKNLTTLSLNAQGQLDHKKGIDEYYHVDRQSPYANSYLLTALLSPDYVDKTGDGISDDDLGTAVKFKYSKIPMYRWRTPYALNDARNADDLATHQKTVTVNRGLLADPDDDKGSIIYGEKEIYYPHSIETKNHIAVFITADRLDGLGVVDWKGAPDASIRQKKLTEIRLYSKSGEVRILVKTVRFNYTYDLCPNTPNSIAANKGKLTLKNVWFEYGKTSKGGHHSYAFNYDNGPNYNSMASDRWGTYKSEGDNWNGFSNEEFPYSTQNFDAANNNVKHYQLSEITLPSGGKIQVGYESDDYSYVQDKRAATMQPIKSFLKLKPDGSGMIPTNQLNEMGYMKLAVAKFPPPGMDDTQWFKDFYLAGSHYIYAKTLVKFSTNNGLDYGCHDDYVSAYSKITKVDFDRDLKEATLTLEPLTDKRTASALQFAAWQKMKNEYPRYAYPGFKNKVGTGDAFKAIKAAISAIANAVGNLSELRENFYDKAARKGYASTVDLQKSFVRLTSVLEKEPVAGNKEYIPKKLGGGLRVKYIKINDDWQDLGEVKDYGQWYDYTTSENNEIVSSGVASYEPSVGSDENSLRQPVSYTQKIKGGLSNLFELETPFGESYYPAPSVIYSKVTVRDLRPDDDVDHLEVINSTDINQITPSTGSIIHEFYTAKDFPVRVSVSDMQKYMPPTIQQYGVLSSNSTNYMVLSQGYRIELNDMHGKSRSQRVLNNGGSEISSVNYNYSVEDPKASQLRLKNKVNVVAPTGLVTEKVMGRDIEFFTDFREQEYVNSGKTRTPGLDVISVFGFPAPIPHFYIDDNNEYKLFRSAAAVKVVQQFGILQNVVKTENGSSITTENIAYDELTGTPLVTRTQNEFNESIYSVNIPAYWVYKGMGGAYQSAGMLISGLSSVGSGILRGALLHNTTMLFHGDQLMDLSDGKKYWVVETNGFKRLIGDDGRIKEGPYVISLAKVLRSGYINMVDETTSTVICMENPIVTSGQDRKLAINTTEDLQHYRVLQASTTLYDEKWSPLTLQINNENIETGRENYYVWARMTQRDNFTEGPFWSNWGTVERKYVYSVLEVKFYKGYSATQPPVFIDENLVNYTGYITIRGRYNSNPFTRYINNAEVAIVQSDEPYTGNRTTDPASLVERYYVNHQFLVGGSESKIYYYRIVDVNNNTRLFSYGDIGGTWLDDYGRIGASGAPIYTSYQVPFNPYLNGYLGNWKPSETKVYQTKRSAISQGKALKVKNNGHFADFYSYWTNSGNSLYGWTAGNSSKWITANTVTQYGKDGQELENRDALGRYSSAQFGFNGQLPLSVASNARNREIYQLNFEEDIVYDANDLPNLKYLQDIFGYPHPSPLNDFLSSNEAHTGNRSLRLYGGGIVLNTKVHNKESKTEPYYTVDPVRHTYLIKPWSENIYNLGFQPVSGAVSYVFSAWIKDPHPSSKASSIDVNVNGTTVNLSCKAVVEGWKLMEGDINLSLANNAEFKMTITPHEGGNVYLDDLRIYPKVSHMKTYTYNTKTFKLMAELDENNFASFYEYDDEGQLVRVKKETERGIVTLKETRTVFKKRSKPTITP